MERKIGEIFEYNGAWYQCVEGTNCRECDFSSNNVTCDIHGAFKCTCKGRSDETSVVFKKLEKVGEPFISGGKLYQHYKVFDIDNIDFTKCTNMNVHNYNKKTLTVEIKQNQEDMEEKKYELEKLLAAFVNSKITYAEYEEKLEDYYKSKYGKRNIEEKELNLKEFNLEAAKQGKPVFTRDGRKARIVCFDAKGDQPIIALVEAKGNKDALIEKVESYFINGHSVFEVRETNNDLMMLPEKKEGWVNVYYNRTDGITFSKHPYPSKEEAIKNAGTMSNIVDTVNISWKE